jgi:hypothetical protein
VDLKTYKLKYKFPPTAYYMMTNDPQTEAQIKKAVHILKDVNNVPADYIFVSTPANLPSTRLLGSVRLAGSESRPR